jgi:CpeT protein
MEKSPAILLFAFFSLIINPLQSQITKDLTELRNLMFGSFSSEAQSKSDTSYFNIHLRMVPIWTNRNDAVWLYIEQAVSTRLDKPYRQRVYKVSETSPGQFESAVYTLKSPLRFAQKPELLEMLSPDSLTLKEGCSVYLQKTGKKKFSGGTRGQSCSSDIKGAAYASSEVTITKKMLLSWDRGFDASGKQVWGAEKGGYRFVRK